MVTEAERDRELDRVKADIFVGNDAAFLGPLMAGLEFRWTDKVETCATDYESILWNPADFDKLTREERVSSLLHELAHNYRLHGVRLGERDQEIWNIACDIPINRSLRKQGYTAPPPYFIQDHPEIRAELEEDIYELLKQQAEKQPKARGNKAGGPPSSLGSGLPQKKGCCSCHQLPPPTKDQAQKAIQNVVKATQQAILAKQPGSIPGCVETLLNTFLKPRIPWQQHLSQWFNDFLGATYSYRRPNRRYRPHDILMRSRFPERSRLDHLVYFFDVSGSVTDPMVTRFNSELKHIKDTYQPKKMTLVLFDTVIQKVIEIKDEDDFNELKIVGRGGTDLHYVREFIMDTDATAAIIFTDLECMPMEKGPTIPIIWICLDNPSATVPFGTLLHLTKDDLQ